MCLPCSEDFHRTRRHPKFGKSRQTRRCHGVDLHQFHLIAGDWRAPAAFRRPKPKRARPKWQGTKNGFTVNARAIVLRNSRTNTLAVILFRPACTSDKRRRGRSLTAVWINASSGPNITAGRNTPAPANAARTAAAPSPRARMQCKGGSESAPIPEIWMNLLTHLVRLIG